MMLIAMYNPDWKYTETMQKKIRVIKVNQKEHHLDAQDLDGASQFCLDAETKLDLGKIKRAKIYQATIKVYTADLSGDLERQLSELALEDEHLRRSLSIMKATGSQLKKFELVAIK
jgi:hypothetical protein